MLRFVDGHTWSEMTLLVSRGIWMMDLDESMGSLLGGDIAGLFWFGYRQGLMKPDLGLVFLLARWIFCFFSPTRACVKQCIASCLKSRTMSMTLCLEHDAPEAISPFPRLEPYSERHGQCQSWLRAAAPAEEYFPYHCYEERPLDIIVRQTI